MSATQRKIGLYVHIPFCERKCNYCDFLSFKLKKEDELNEYVGNLCQEIKFVSEFFIDACNTHNHNIEKLRNVNTHMFCNDEIDLHNRVIVDTVFIGGGTPSLLSTQNVKQILTTIYNNFEISNDIEITIESNPNSLTEEKLEFYKKIGINRLSIGIQSFDDNILKLLGRVHDSKIAKQSIELAKNVGFENINIDLMFGVPGQDMQKWSDTLKQAIDLQPTHISFYSLQIEENTPFYNWYRQEKLPFIENITMNEMYLFAIDNLKRAGYEHYEISNTSKKFYICKHNMKYWQMQEYIGVGVGATSYVENSRYIISEDVKEWKNIVKDKKQYFSILLNKLQEKEDIHTSISSFVFTALRTRDGVDLKKFKNIYNIDFWEYYKDISDIIWQYIEDSLLMIEDNHLKLTLEGILVSNDIMCEFV